jgi:hypothetical protein
MAKSPDLSGVLDEIKQQISSYTSERTALVGSLHKVIKDAQKLLADLGEAPSSTSTTMHVFAPGAVKKRTLSAEARKKLADAARKRWKAAHKAGKKHL